MRAHCFEGNQIAQITAISTRYSGAASFDSTVARAGVLPGETHGSHAEFISANVDMLTSQMVADRILDLSVPAAAINASICLRMVVVCSFTVAPLATCPAMYSVPL